MSAAALALGVAAGDAFFRRNGWDHRIRTLTCGPGAPGSRMFIVEGPGPGRVAYAFDHPRKEISVVTTPPPPLERSWPDAW